ncbi:MAG: 2-oxoacid:acceptor oxidoreductase subunit alpha [Planctomycetes bacterium]|nr:2-oxoacid:acceptor oxidoreductase subunit alpha [Planctomycetota bacterium]MBI3848543.1 2-oxoacid:acceptor oxidoreductase subunit alpha [Planctomycetota bacterium]
MIEAVRRTVVNDMTIQVATVNGSGSQSANNILLKSFFRMGIPVGGKNLFPSNIQGLPTWYTIRVNHRGYVGRKAQLDFLVAMNPNTAKEDYHQVVPGGVIICDSEWTIDPADRRDDVAWYPVPFAQLCKDNVENAKLRRLLTNMIYVGVVAELLGIDNEILDAALRDQFASKAKVVESNRKMIELGKDFVRKNLAKKDPFRVEKMNANGNKILIDGNSASALGCVFGGCTVVAWYPITPSSSLPESVIDFLNQHRKDEATGKNRFAVVQAEDEIAALGMVIGAGWAGARAMTSTSGPGISLMSEFVGLGYFAEIPAVIFDVQRVGPSTGLPTRTAQGDVLKVVTLSHGDTKHVALFPGSVQECFEMGWRAFDLADRLQTPVFVLTDLDLGMNNWMADPFEYPDKPLDRGKVLDADAIKRLGKFERYRDVDGDAVGWRTLPGTRHPAAAYFTRGSGHNEKALYTERGDDYVHLMDRLARKHQTAAQLVPAPVESSDSGAQIGVIAYGSTDSPMAECRDQLREKGIRSSYLRIRAFPFTRAVRAFIEKFERIYVIEQNRDGQMLALLRIEYPELATRLRSVRHYDGLPIDARFMSDHVIEQEHSSKKELIHG